MRPRRNPLAGEAVTDLYTYADRFEYANRGDGDGIGPGCYRIGRQQEEWEGIRAVAD